MRFCDTEKSASKMQFAHLISSLILISLPDCACKWTTRLEFDSPIFLKKTTLRRDLLLTCHYDFNNEYKLYSLKILRNDSVFYSYVPSGELPVRVFKYDGIEIDNDYPTKSNQVMLKNIGVDSADVYGCEVSTDFPNFFTKVTLKKLDVIVKPKSRPTISLDRRIYNLGDVLEVNCTTEPSFPQQRLLWIVNGAPLNEAFFDNETNATSDPYMQSTISTMSFQVARSYFGTKGKLSIKCISVIGKHYRKSITASVLLNMTSIMPDEVEAWQTDGGTSSQTKVFSNFWIVIATLVFNITIGNHKLRIFSVT